MLSEEAINDFKRIYQEEFGGDVSNEFASQLGINLLALMNHVYRPIKKDWDDNF